MNNNQFRRLVLDASTPSRDGARSGESSTKGNPALGSRMRSSIPMTPRSVAGSARNDFARQLAERNAELNGQNARKFRSSAAPKGTKLGAGYQDRTQLRIADEEDDKTTRIKALEDMVKLGQIDSTTFEKLRDEITGGDVQASHLVKGLDYALLKRVRGGEDVFAERSNPAQIEIEHPPEDEEPEVDVDQQFQELEEKEIQPITKEQKSQKEQMGPPPPVASKKRTRDDILKELKASRASAIRESKPSEPQLGPKFSKVGQKKDQSRVERDDKGREVLILVDAEGNIKRKVRKPKNDVEGGRNSLLMPTKGVAPLGMEVPDGHVLQNPEDEEDGDIFEDVGKTYDALADIKDDSSSSGAESGAEEDEKIASEQPPQDSRTATNHPSTTTAATSSAPSTPLPCQAAPHKYFEDEMDAEVAAPSENNPLQDPAILAALKKAAAIKPLHDTSSESKGGTDEDAAKLARRRQMLDNRDRDAEDMDLGFGSSRFGDAEDGEDGDDGKRIKLSVWGEDDRDGKGDGNGGKGGQKRKRGPKKRKKGDGDNAADVLRVMESRRSEKKK